MTPRDDKGSAKERSPRLVRPERPDVSLVTGFPAFTARRLLARLVEADPRERVFLLCQPKFRASAEAELAAMKPAARRRVEIVEGDVCDMDLGLPGAEYQALVAGLTAIHHAAAIYYLGAKKEQVEQVNVEGTRNMLDVAADTPRLRRFVHWSSASVSGAREGVVLEEELDCGQRFRNMYEASKFRAEQLVEAKKARLPITILRPGVIVGDSRTGEIDKFDGPYYLLVLIVSSPAGVRLPLPGAGVAPLHLVPIDFVVDAAVQLSRDPRAEGGTFHLTDPCPLGARTIYELVAACAEKKAPRGSFPAGLARALMRAPGLERLARAPRAFLEAFNHLALYNCRRTMALLEDTDIRCPPFDAYVEPLVRFVREEKEKRKHRVEVEEEEAADPFE